MCIAIVKKKDAVITDEELKNCFENSRRCRIGIHER